MFAQFRDCCLSVRLLLHMVKEAGFEPTWMLVTPGRLRNAKRKIIREWREVAAFAARQSFDACDFPPFAYFQNDFGLK